EGGLKCAKKSGLYCEKHERPHTGFGRQMEMSACILCAVDLVDENRHRVGIILGMLQDAAPEDFAILRQEQTWMINNEEDENVAILFHLSATALCHKTTFDELIRQLVVAGSLDKIKNQPL
ncbi:hypothetical protein KW796_02750, partial [Candidatus Parcubacteria bacterium]|nr:hypothetical protein [Candidatus Parcubacteria bacterium]